MEKGSPAYMKGLFCFARRENKQKPIWCRDLLAMKIDDIKSSIREAALIRAEGLYVFVVVTPGRYDDFGTEPTTSRTLIPAFENDFRGYISFCQSALEKKGTFQFPVQMLDDNDHIDFTASHNSNTFG